MLAIGSIEALLTNAATVCVWTALCIAAASALFQTVNATGALLTRNITVVAYKIDARIRLLSLVRLLGFLEVSIESFNKLFPYPANRVCRPNFCTCRFYDTRLSDTYRHRNTKWRKSGSSISDELNSSLFSPRAWSVRKQMHWISPFQTSSSSDPLSTRNRIYNSVRTSAEDTLKGNWN